MVYPYYAHIVGWPINKSLVNLQWSSKTCNIIQLVNTPYYKCRGQPIVWLAVFTKEWRQVSSCGFLHHREISGFARVRARGREITCSLPEGIQSCARHQVCPFCNQPRYQALRGWECYHMIHVTCTCWVCFVLGWLSLHILQWHQVQRLH